MADYMAAQITIGGSVPQRLVPRLCAVISRQGIRLEWGDVVFRPGTAQELLEARRQVDGRLCLRLCDDEVAYGQFDQLEEFLVRHRIPYDRHAEGKYEFDPVLVFFRPPQEPIALLATSTGQVVTHAAPLWSLADKFSAARVDGHVDAAQALRRLVRELKRALPPEPPLLTEFNILPPGAARRASSERRPTTH